MMLIVFTFKRESTRQKKLPLCCACSVFRMLPQTLPEKMKVGKTKILHCKREVLNEQQEKEKPVRGGKQGKIELGMEEKKKRKKMGSSCLDTLG